MPKIKKNDFTSKFAIRPPAKRIGFEKRSFGRFYSGKEAPKPRWDRNSYGCGIISVDAKKRVNFRENRTYTVLRKELKFCRRPWIV
jgi:hypothetical protein